MTNRSDLSTHIDNNGNRNVQAQQLARLAQSFAPTTALSLISATLQDGSVSTTATGRALARDTLLTQTLRHAVVYQHTSDNHSPERDFVILSTSSQTSQVVEALSRLASAFVEVRGSLASAIAQAATSSNREGALPYVGSANHDDVRVLNETFATVNACFILVITTTHARFDESEQFRRDLAEVFQKLLECDPFLKQLAPSFEALKSATSTDARKVALRQFFETFCDEAQQPTLYEPAFSAVVQSILLREL